MPHAHRGRYTHAKHSPETRVGSFAADVQQLSKSGRLLGRPVREAGFRDSSRRQILCGVLNKVLIDFDDFGARQARGRSGRFSDLPDRALETSRHEPPRREAKTRPSSTTRTTTMINLENESASTAATTKSIPTRRGRRTTTTIAFENNSCHRRRRGKSIAPTTTTATSRNIKNPIGTAAAATTRIPKRTSGHQQIQVLMQHMDT